MTRQEGRDTELTFSRLVELLAELEPRLHSRFPTLAAEYGLDMAFEAGFSYIQQAQQGTAPKLKNDKGYFSVIAHRAAKRFQGREPATVPIDLVPIAWPSSDFVEEVGADLGSVLAALDDLPNRQKEAITLHILNRLSPSDAGRKMGVPRQTVHRAVQCGLAKLRKMLSSEFPGR
jgi:DNA-directed RNA polymerase specialized sigma24 family protein